MCRHNFGELASYRLTFLQGDAEKHNLRISYRVIMGIIRYLIDASSNK